MATARQVLLAPHQSEKATSHGERHNTVTFRVDRSANRTEIRRAVEAKYGVSVLSVRTLIAHGKLRRRGSSVGRLAKVKKAFVVLKAGSKIDFLAAAE